MERQFDGIYIPAEIWNAKDLNWNEKILLMEINSYTRNGKDCFISNEYIANFLNVTETSGNRILSSLIKKGYVDKVRFDGRSRFIKSNIVVQVKADLSQSAEQGCQERQGRVAKKDNILYTDTNINIPNNKNIDKSISKDSEIGFVGQEHTDVLPYAKNSLIPPTPLDGSEGKPKQNKKTKQPAFDVRADLSYVSEHFMKLWMYWLDYKDEIKRQYKTKRGIESMYKSLVKYSRDNIILAHAIIMNSIEKSYDGFFGLSDKQVEFFLSNNSPYIDRAKEFTDIDQPEEPEEKKAGNRWQ